MASITLGGWLVGSWEPLVLEDDNRPDDVGCSVAPRCTACPLAECKYDDPDGYLTWMAEEVAAGRLTTKDRSVLSRVRDLKVVVAREEGKPIGQVLKELRITEKTYYRAMGRLGIDPAVYDHRRDKP